MTRGTAWGDPVLTPVTQDPPQLGELVRQHSRYHTIEGRAEVHKRDPGIVVCGVQVLKDEVESHVSTI